MNRTSSTACLAEYAFAMELDDVPATSGPGEERQSKGHFICTWQDAFSSEASTAKSPEEPRQSRATRGGGQRGWPPGSLDESTSASTPPPSKRGFAQEAPGRTASDIKGDAGAAARRGARREVRVDRGREALLEILRPGSAGRASEGGSGAECAPRRAGAAEPARRLRACCLMW
eukprot:CAMPEP_0173427302 /NCGR_PEP_ID=MMETSP1357-20121228/6527_1 /TAXON_ID=77926 /ORGANISM="Hemiselmis rufescens, Strain PCC563" /LENGTH=173 /DNA_ID=CAMNT_0014391111 /DNA_START=284 /DNA_END=803 /DNA_ORIENTATION=-